MADELGYHADQLRSLIPQKNALLILGVQRTGTTLLAQDITSLGAVGTPGEHYLKAKEDAADLNAQFGAFARRGALSGGDTFAATLMSNYLAAFGRWFVTGGESATAKVPNHDLEDVAMRFFSERFERLTVVTLVRLPIWKAAYSHWRVSITNQYHNYADGVKTGQRLVSWQPGQPIVPDAEGILKFAEKIQKDYLRIASVLLRHAITPVELTYDEIINNFPGYLTKVTNAAGHTNVDISRAQRRQTKLTPDAEIEAARIALQIYLGTEID